MISKSRSNIYTLSHKVQRITLAWYVGFIGNYNQTISTLPPCQTKSKGPQNLNPLTSLYW